MNLTPAQREQGRRNFLKALAGTPALAALAVASYARGPVKGGPVRVGFIGIGGQGRALLGVAQPPFVEVRALCDINPAQLKQADAILAGNKLPPAKHYSEWKEMLAQEDLEAVIMAPPLFLHADLAVGCLDAGKHVLCEKMMAWDAAGCERMRDAALRNNRVLEIGYQRFYSPLYDAANTGILKRGLLGDVYHARLAWHRNGNWRRQGQPPSANYDPSRWGYPSYEHLLNWRLYQKYSRGLFAELGSHQVSIASWVFGAAPEAVYASGGVYRFQDGRESADHVYGTFEYPGGRTAVFSSIESNAFDNYYEMFLGTKGTLIMSAEQEALLFEEGSEGARTTVEIATTAAGAPVVESTETQPGNRPADPRASSAAPGQRFERRTSTRLEIERFAQAVRTGEPLACGPDRAMISARACIRATESMEQHARLTL
jgi:predicted dehydrogenase